MKLSATTTAFWTVSAMDLPSNRTEWCRVIPLLSGLEVEHREPDVERVAGPPMVGRSNSDADVIHGNEMNFAPGGLETFAGAGVHLKSPVVKMLGTG
jgi:hypothetical protein